MTTEKLLPEDESLGQFLKRTRRARGYELSHMIEETRISSSNLMAMEEDAYSSLPADAFCRGFYAIYARALGLDPEKIVARYRAERGVTARKGNTIAYNPPAHKAAQQVGNMATPSGVSPLSTVGYILLLLIILTGGLCWYFNINPATFLSEKLRSLQGEPPAPEAKPQENGATSRDTESPVAVDSELVGKLAHHTILRGPGCRIVVTFDQKGYLA